MHSFVKSAHLIRPRRQCRFLDPLAFLRFQEAESPTGKSKSKRSGDRRTAICPGVLLCRDKVLAGADLFQELQSLYSDPDKPLNPTALYP